MQPARQGFRAKGAIKHLARFLMPSLALPWSIPDALWQARRAGGPCIRV